MNVSTKMFLKNKLNTTCMSKTDTATSYLMKIIKLRDQIEVVGDKVEDSELVWNYLNGFNPPWHNIVQSIHGQVSLPYIKQLWDAFVRGCSRPNHHWKGEEGRKEKIW